MDQLGICPVCYQYFFVQQHVSLLKTNFGTLQSILSRQGCTICDFLYVSLQRLATGPIEVLDGNHGNTKVGCWLRTYIRHPTEILVIYNGVAQFELCQVVDYFLHQTWKVWGLSLAMPMFPGTRDWPYTGDGSMIDPYWVRNFLQKCRGARIGGPHGIAKGCGSRVTFSKSMKLDLIDVHKLRLVRSNSSARYVSLSYVWGHPEVLKTNKQNRQKLMKQGAFEVYRPAPIIQDAMQLVRMIGERYLWVDALCIPQDDKKLTAFYVNRMDNIYSQSVLTVIAASSRSAMDRLPGVRPGSRSPQHTPKVGNMRLVRRTRELDEPLDESMYESRAWTFQERILSNRCLILTKFEAFLSCPSFLLSELHGSLPEACKRFHPLRQLTPTGAKYEGQRDISSYRDLVVSYTKRHLTYEADILRAFAGISTFLESKMLTGRMLFGLPTINFALALGWIPRGPSIRRTVCTTPDGAQHLALPSWTWAGWTGRKDWPPPFAFFDHSTFRPHLFVSDIERFDFGSGERWQDINVRGDLLASPSTPCMLRFVATWLHASQLLFKPFSQKALVIKDFDQRKHYKLDFPVIEINGRNPRHTYGGLVFGADLTQMNDPNVVLIAIAHWNYSGDYWLTSTTYKLSGYHFPSILRFLSTIEDPNLEDMYPRNVLDVSFYTCVVARWIDKEHMICERIGLAHVAASLWLLKSLEKTEGAVRLA